MSTYTHERIPRKATCIQYAGDNTSECVMVLFECGAACDTATEGRIVIRWPDNREDNIRALNIGDWIVIGEDRIARIYGDDIMSIKYRELP